MKTSTRMALVGIGVLAAGMFQDGENGPLSLVRDAEAIVGMPGTPVSVAGVARRTTRRVIRRSTIYVASLPPSCAVVVIEGTTLHHCGGTYYEPYGRQYVVVYVD